MARIGYARVSSSDQDLALQLAPLKEVGCEVTRAETASGASRDGRQELSTIISFLRSGDELVVTRLDRLGRNTRDVLNIVHEVGEKGDARQRTRTCCHREGTRMLAHAGLPRRPIVAIG